MVNFSTLLDDSALVATDLTVIQEIVDRLSYAACHFGMKIDLSKTELFYQPPQNKPPTCNEIMLNGSALQKAEHFSHLGCTVTNNNSSDLEVDMWIQVADKAFGALQQRI